MSEGDVSGIRDEDVLRRMWQQTEDFSRKKEIRAHMYRLREERLRNLYAEPAANGKGLDQMHVTSLGDQSFQRMKRKEVRDAGSPSPPRDFAHALVPAAPAQELKELSNAGWNVESEDRRSDDGRTRSRAINATIEGRYDVPGGEGKFAARDQQRQTRTEYQDDNVSVKRDETSASTASREQVVRQTDDGTQFSSMTSSSSTATSKFEQTSTHEVPYQTDYDQETNREKITRINDYEQSLRSDSSKGELVSRKVDYPDSNTKVIVETRCLPDGTRVTSTRREFRAPVQSSHSEQHFSKNESRSYSSQHRSDTRESSKVTQEYDNRSRDIVDHQRQSDDFDFKKNQVEHHHKDDFSQTRKNQQSSETKHFETRHSASKVTRESIDSRQQDSQRKTDDYDVIRNQKIDDATQKDDYSKIRQSNLTDKNNQQTDLTQKENFSSKRTNYYETKIDEYDHRDFVTPDDKYTQRDVKDTHSVKNDECHVINIKKDRKLEEIVEKKTSDQYQTTYQTDFTQKKISNDWSPTHQAWASTLRSDSPSSTRPTTRASSPGSRTFQSSTSSLRSSISPDKTHKKPPSRGSSPNKIDRQSPSRSTTERYSSTHSTHSVSETKTNKYTSPDRRPSSGPRPSSSPERRPDAYHQRPSQSPDKRTFRPSPSPERKPGSIPTESYPKTSSGRDMNGSPARSGVSPSRKPGYMPSDIRPDRSSISPEKRVSDRPTDFPTRPSQSPDRKSGVPRPSAGAKPEQTDDKTTTPRSSLSPERKPGYMRPTATSKPMDSPRYTSPDRKSPSKQINSKSQIKEDHYKFIDEETKMYTRSDQDSISSLKTTSSPQVSRPRDHSPSSSRKSPDDCPDSRRSESPSILRKDHRSPSPPKGPVTFTEDQTDNFVLSVDTTNITTKYSSRKDSPVRDTTRELSPTKYGTYEKKDSRVTSTTYDSKDTRYDSLTRREKTTNKVTDILASPTKKSPRDSVSPTKGAQSPREPSPVKYGTYDRKDRRSEEIETSTITTTKDSTDVKYDSLTRRQKTKNVPSSPTNKSPRQSVSPTKMGDHPRESSPSKYDTYDRKQQSEKSEEVTITTNNTSDTKYDSLTCHQKTTNVPLSPTKKSPRKSVSPTKREESPRESSPSKYDTYDRKQRKAETQEVTITIKDSSDTKFDSLRCRQKTTDVPMSPTKKTLRDSVSPVKSPTRDAKYKHTTDFISTERTTEEINKQTTKDRSRHLVTPSSSPTRKPKVVEKEPSTGQSSPTTSVSEFTYISSPKRPIITDLDDQEFYTGNQTTEETTTTYTRPETLDIKGSPSPSKIPCRSPSPPKKVSPTKESFPRKSSLKKPSTDTILVSPVEKPPSSFCVSPEVDKKEFPEYKIVKKDNPDKSNDSPIKSKPPFERRETYEERCLKILGMITDDKTQTKEDTEPRSTASSPVSPCDAPDAKIQSVFTDVMKEITKVGVTDFITSEQEDTTKKTTRRADVVTINKKSQTPSRDSSPTKLQDIISQKTVTNYEDVTFEDSLLNTTTEVESPDRDMGYQKPKDDKAAKTHSPRTSPLRSASPEKKTPKSPKESATQNRSPDRKPSYQKPTETEPQRTTSPTRLQAKESVPLRSNVTPERKLASPTKPIPNRSSPSPTRVPGYMKPTASTVTKHDFTSTTEETQDISTTVRESIDRETGYYKIETSHTPTPSQPKDKLSKSPERKQHEHTSSPSKISPIKKPEDKKPSKASVSPDRVPGYMKPTSATITKHETTTEELRTDNITRTQKTEELRPSSPGKSETTRLSRTPSPTKTVTKTTEDITDFLQSEREQEILNKVQESLRKLSPVRDQRSSSRERSPGKSGLSLQDIDVVTTESLTKEVISEKDTENKKQTTNTSVSRIGKLKEEKPKEQMPASKPPSRTVSPTKKPPSSPTKPEKSPDSLKPRSVSPKKPVSPTERSQSPQIPRATGIKSKLSPTTMTTSKTEKVTTDVKKTADVTKQNNLTKTSTARTVTSKYSPTSRNEPEPRRAPTPKGNKENVSPKKEDVKVTRVSSDISLKTKKVSPQRMKSKPEIQVNDLSTTKTKITTTTPTKKSTIKEPHSRLAPKPKSATALNTSLDDDDIIIDVEQAKSSRENSPDRICPTPVGFLEDVGTPRLPDEVSEPDDDFRKRTHHTIHEAESIVDDIVEICEDDELFVKKTDVDHATESDECLLSVIDKVSKFTNKIDSVTKPKDQAAHFKDVERKVHSDFTDQNLKTDEYSLSVSEKVNKFTKAPKDINEKSSSRRIIDEYDTDTVYQDDYTRLSVNDKAHYFVETAENVKQPKTKPAQKLERPDLSNVDDDLKSDDCLLSVSDKVNKFVKTAEQFLSETHDVEEKEKKVKEQYDKIMKHIVQDDDDENDSLTSDDVIERKSPDEQIPSFAKETASSHSKVRDVASPNLKPAERPPTVKITTLRSSEAVKKAKALFENIASSQTTKDTKTTKLLDIGVTKKSPKSDSTTVLHPSVEDSPNLTDSEVDAPHTPITKDQPKNGTFPRSHSKNRPEERLRSPSRTTSQSPEVPRTQSPLRQTVETTTVTKTLLSRYPAAQNESRPTRPEPEKETQTKVPKSPSVKPVKPEPEKPQDKVPGYQRSTKSSQVREEKTEEPDVSTRRGSGKFGVELRRTSVERSTVSSERRRSSTDHHQPCIEDIFDVDLLEQMLEKVVGYEQRRRIRAQIRVAKKKMESEQTYTKTTKLTTMTTTIQNKRESKSPERRHLNKSPERQKTAMPRKPSPDRVPKSASTPQKIVPETEDQTKPFLNGHSKEPSNLSDKKRPQSPEKPRPTVKTKSPVRQPSPDKRTRTTSPTKTTPKTKTSRFSEYATAYMKKVGLNDTDKAKFSDKPKKSTDVTDYKTEQIRSKKTDVDDHTTVNQYETKTETRTTSTTKSFSERTSSKDTIEVVQSNGKRSPSPEKKRPTHSPTERLYQRSPSPDFKRTKSDKAETIIKTVYEVDSPKAVQKETIIRTVYEERPKVASKMSVTTTYDIEKKQPKQVQEEKPSWVTNRNLKKITSETRTFSSKKLESEKPKYRATSPSKAITKPIDVITSSYGPGPLDADGRPLFGIKALRNGASNYQVKGTVVRQEYHSRNGGEPEGSVSVTAYSTEPEDLEKLLKSQGEPPSRIHGLAAITTTKRFGGDTGTSLNEVHTKEDRASIEQFTQSGRRVSDEKIIRERPQKIEGKGRSGEERREKIDRREDKKTVRQSSVKSLTEKYIKSASDTSKSEKTTYPKAGLILRTANMRDSVSSDSSTHAGMGRTDSELSLGSVEEHKPVTTRTQHAHHATTTHHSSGHTRQVQGTHQSSHQSSQRTEQSFLDSSTKVSGVQDILTRMKNADIVIQEGDTTEDSEARALLNKFLGATVLMAGMQNYVTEKPSGKVTVKQETVRTSGGKTTTTRRVEELDLDQCWDERVLKDLLDECTDYEQRRRLRARLRTLMAEQEACASAVTEALAESGADAREEEEVTVTSSARRDSSEKTVSSTTTTKTSKVIESMTRPAPKPVSPFAKFRQLEKQNSTSSPKM